MIEATAQSEARCALCGARRLPLAFTGEQQGQTFRSYLCDDCQLYQTQGNVAPVSPDYIDLDEGDLDAQHVFIQTEHKRAAFEQWADLMAALSGQPFAGPGRETRALIEIGCGVGGFLDFIEPLGIGRYGFDASRAQVAVAARRHPHVTVATDPCDYVASLGPDAPRFSFAVMWDVFEHLREPAEMLAALRGVMAPGGLLFLSVPSAGPIAAKLALGRFSGQPTGNALLPWEHVFYHSPKSLRRLFSATGWRAVQIGGVATYKRTMSPAEALRRAGHAMLRQTPWAPQIHAIAAAEGVPDA